MRTLLITLMMLILSQPVFGNPIVTKIYFDTDKADIRSTEFEKLNIAVDTIDKGVIVVVLVGNADKRGENIYNLELSQRRTEVVKKYLRDQGVEGEIILGFSYGEEANVSPDDLQENRRVDVLSFEPEILIHETEIKNLYKNRLRIYGGGGPFLLHEHEYSDSHVRVDQSYSIVFGLGYSRLLTDRWSLGISGFSNLSGFLNVGFDF